MIEFNCPNCQKRFKVPQELAGRSARCKGCGGTLVVPMRSPAIPMPIGSPMADSEMARSPVAPQAAPVAPPIAPPPAPSPVVPAGPRVPMRTKRLLADAKHMSEAFNGSDVIKVLSVEGNPPDLYRVAYHIASLGPTDHPEQPAPRDAHEVEIQLTGEYPRSSPKCKMLTPIYHPNIDPTQICVGDHWAAGERLVDLVIRIGEMIAYQAYNIKSPLDAHAAMWADLNPDKLPTDPRTIRPAE